MVLFTNETPVDDQQFFDGPALTYYGRWTYKFEEATRSGAIACLIVHTTPTASYGWEVVRIFMGQGRPAGSTVARRTGSAPPAGSARPRRRIVRPRPAIPSRDC